MIISKKNIYVLLMLGIALCSCSESDDMAIGGNEVANEEQNGVSVVFRFQTNGLSSLTTRSAEDSYSHVQGTADEYKVNNARVYLFDSSTKLFAKSVVLPSLTRAGSDVNGNIIYEAEHVAVPQGTFDIFVTANTDRVIDKKTEAEFLADIDSISYVRGQIEDISKGIIMTNRASDNLGVVFMNKPQKDDNVVSITLERVVARLDIAKGADAFQLTDDKSSIYATVSLTGYYIVNLAKYYYSYRHTAVLTDLEEPKWNVNEHFGNVNEVNGYVIDPDFFKKTIDAASFNNSDKYFEHFFGDYNNPQAVTWGQFKPAASTPQYNTVYCLENCALAPAQKNGYSMGVIFKAKVEPYNNVFHLEADGSLTLVTDVSKYPEVLYYYNYKFYDSAEALASVLKVASITDKTISMYQARKFEKSDEGYMCYYTYWIRHLDNYNPTVMGVMEFGVVRNNLYRMLVTNVSGLGYHEQPIDPDTPDEGETYLKVVLNVKPWIVRDLTNIVL